MTKNETRLLDIIRNHENPTEAITIAIGIISAFLAQPQSFEESYLVSHEEQA